MGTTQPDENTTEKHEDISAESVETYQQADNSKLNKQLEEQSKIVDEQSEYFQKVIMGLRNENEQLYKKFETTLREKEELQTRYDEITESFKDNVSIYQNDFLY